MKILVDMNLSPGWADYLTGNGIEAAHWSSCGPADSPDSTIMAYAKERNFVVFINDLDFGNILAPEIEQGALVTIDINKTRLHLLPL